MKRFILITLLTFLPGLSFAVGDFDETKALADQGNIDAQLNLGLMYHSGKGKGVKRDFDKSFELFLKVANQGNAIAQSMLSVSYYYGQGVKKNRYEAYVWSLTAEKFGNTKAQNFGQLISKKFSSSELISAQQRATELHVEIQNRIAKEKQGKPHSDEKKELVASTADNPSSKIIATSSYIDEPKGLAILRDEGVITEDEFQQQKTKIPERE